MQTDVIKEQVTCFLPFLGIKPSTSGLGVQHHQYSHSTVLPQRQDMIMGSSPQALLCDWLFGHYKRTGTSPAHGPRRDATSPLNI
ncbi:unnamed protein product [Boreogadus saida]